MFLFIDMFRKFILNHVVDLDDILRCDAVVAVICRSIGLPGSSPAKALSSVFVKGVVETAWVKDTLVQDGVGSAQPASGKGSCAWRGCVALVVLSIANSLEGQAAETVIDTAKRICNNMRSNW
jgi:hypothetical protein